MCHQIIVVNSKIKLTFSTKSLFTKRKLVLSAIGLFHKVHRTKDIEHLVDLFKIKTGPGPTKTLTNALIRALSIKFGRTFSVRECENILCKVTRKDICSGNKRCDVVYKNQGIFEAYDDHIVIHVADKDNSQNNIEGEICMDLF